MHCFLGALVWLIVMNGEWWVKSKKKNSFCRGDICGLRQTKGDTVCSVPAHYSTLPQYDTPTTVLLDENRLSGNYQHCRDNTSDSNISVPAISLIYF